MITIYFGCSLQALIQNWHRGSVQLSLPLLPAQAGRVLPPSCGPNTQPQCTHTHKHTCMHTHANTCAHRCACTLHTCRPHISAPAPWNHFQHLFTSDLQRLLSCKALKGHSLPHTFRPPPAPPSLKPCLHLPQLPDHGKETFRWRWAAANPASGHRPHHPHQWGCPESGCQLQDVLPFLSSQPPPDPC